MARRQRRQGAATTAPGLVHPGAAGLDIGAKGVFAAVDPAMATPAIRRFDTFTRDLQALADWLRQCGVRTVAMESTGVYWIPVFQVLERCGLEVLLVNARHVKNVPGRKTDVADCEWLRYLHAVGLLRGSFRPAQQVCAVRSLMRHREQLVRTASRAVLHMQKAYDQMNIHLHHVLSDLTGVSGLRITDAILAGERDPAVLVALAHPSLRAPKEELLKSLEGDWRPEHLFTLQQSRRTYAHYQTLIAECDREIHRQVLAFDPGDEASGPPPTGGPVGSQRAAAPAETDRSSLAAHCARLWGTDLTLIPGIGANVVQVLFSEVGPDFSAFPTAAHFCSWLGLCPRNEISGDRRIRSRTRPGSQRVAQALRWATQSLSRNRSYFGQLYGRLRSRLGAPKAIVAVAHKYARIIYHLITHRLAYDETRLHQLDAQQQRRLRNRLQQQARSLGLKLVPVASS